MSYAEYDRMESERERNACADADEARDAEIALEMRSTENDDGTITIEPEHEGNGRFANPVHFALNGWRNAVVSVARMREERRAA